MPLHPASVSRIRETWHTTASLDVSAAEAQGNLQHAQS